MTTEIWSIASSVVSVILALFAIGISIWFFIVGRKTESAVENSLTQIKTQTEMLQKLSGKQLDRLTKYVTEPREALPSQDLAKVVQALTQLPVSLSATLIQTTGRTDDASGLRAEIINCYIAVYFYSAQANFWAQINLPGAAEFDPHNEFDSACKRVVDMSAADFVYSAQVLGTVDQAELASARLKGLLDETMSVWKDLVKNSSQVYEQRASQA